MLPRIFFDAFLFAPKYVITNLKINNLRKKNQPENLIGILFPPEINLDEHVSTKRNTFRIYKGGGGSRGFFFKIKQNGGFSLFFLLFGKAPYIPKL